MAMAAEKVEGIEDLLLAILVFLPPRPLFRFRCVSKRWNNILSSPFFLQSYSSRRSTSSSSSSSSKKFNQRLFGMRMNLTEEEQAPSAKLDCYFMSSSDGLLLCGCHPDKYRIFNPFTRVSVSLPPPHKQEDAAMELWTRVQLPPTLTMGLVSLGLVCEENTTVLRANYKVVRARALPPLSTQKTLSIQTYSSKTGEWVKSTLSATGSFNLLRFRHPDVFNGVFHWITEGSAGLAVYDSNWPENHLQLINLPCQTLSMNMCRSPSDDVLWFGINNNINGLQFWMLPKDGGYKRSTTIQNTEWILMYNISNCLLRKEIITNNSIHGIEDDNTIPRFFYLLQFIPWKPLVALLWCGENNCIYNLGTKSVELVQYDGYVDLTTSSTGELVPFGWRPATEPLFLSSYAL